VAGDCVPVGPALIPEIQRLEFSPTRASDRDGCARYFGARPGVCCQRDNWPVYFADASVVFEVLKERPAAELDGGAIGGCDPYPSSAGLDGKLLAGEVLHALELVLMEVAFSLRDEELVARFEAEGTRWFCSR